jgi:1,4-dihydroxy-2-naphthoate octaprenyltransferase
VTKTVSEATNREKSQNAWVLAARPRTLPAAVAPVLVGSALAYRDAAFCWLPATAALLVALSLQIGVNLANDYFDYIKGVDTNQRTGPLRVTQSGLLAPAAVRTGMLLALGLSLVPGIYLVILGGWPVAVAGMAALMAALAYSGGPFPLASHGLGDVFVFIFFGLVAVCGTYYVQAGRITFASVAVAGIVGVLITAILVVNNLRDIETDRKAGKRTLAVMLDVAGTRVEYTALLIAGYVGLPALCLTGIRSAWVMLPVLSLPVGISLIRRIWHGTAGPQLNRLLAATASLALVFSLLLAFGLVFSVHLPG